MHVKMIRVKIIGCTRRIRKPLNYFVQIYFDLTFHLLGYSYPLAAFYPLGIKSFDFL